VKSLFFGLLLLLLCGCQTVTIVPKGEFKTSAAPTFEKRLPFYLAGIVGEREVDAKEVCGSRGIRQIQTQHTFMDGFLNVVTLTIYSPRTVKIWCIEGGQS
jgi:hypothetical protein